MGNIVLLDDLTINKIAAGEVIERPASVVKELVENSIDAGSTNISVEIKNGGISYIRITDNGKGFLPDDMEIAFERHATSKIRQADDLETVKSMGFRGEALASIAAIARVELVSKTENSDTGYKIIVEGGKIISKEEAGCPKGSTITVENLFYNTPVRYKFLKKDYTESGYIEDIITRIALVNPDVAIKLVNNGKTIVQTSGNGNIKDIIYGIYGKEVAENLESVNYSFDDLQVSGVIGKPQIARSNRANQLFFVNKRFVKDKTLSSAAEQAFKGMLTIGKYGFLVLNIDMDPHKVDVNVHPAKLEVRFADENGIFKLVYHAIKESLLKQDFLGDSDRVSINQVNTIINNDMQKQTYIGKTAEGAGNMGLEVTKPAQLSEFEKTQVPAQIERTNILPGNIYSTSKEENIKTEEIKKELVEEPIKLGVEDTKVQATSSEVPEETKKHLNEFFKNIINSKKPIDADVLKQAYANNVIEQIYNEKAGISEYVNSQKDNVEDKKLNVEDKNENEEISPIDEVEEKIREMTMGATTTKVNTFNTDKEQKSFEELSEEEKKSFEEMYEKTFGKMPASMKKVEEKSEEYVLDELNAKPVENISLFNKEDIISKPNYKIIGVAFSTYIIIEIANEMYIIDQHAAHERIMYEKIKKNYYNNGSKDSQLMLLPDIINLTHKEMGIAKDNWRLFENAGFELEEFGDNTIKLTGVPNICLDLDTKQLFLETLDEINTVARTAKQEIEEKFIATIACKAAVKANMALTIPEIENLMNELLKLPNPFTCPHGRPTAIQMSKEEIEKKFSRR